jgi:tetrahydromethanopterin S-methyltransferase subunit E
VKAYVATTGVIFGLIVVAHAWRAIEEGSAMAMHPDFIALTAAAAALAFWSWRVFKSIRRP